MILKIMKQCAAYTVALVESGPKKNFLVSLDKIFEKTLKKNFSIIPWC